MLTDNLGNSGTCSNDRWLLYSHRHNITLPIDLEANTEAQRYGHHSNAILNHVVSQCRCKAALGQYLGIDSRYQFNQLVLSLLQRLSVEVLHDFLEELLVEVLIVRETTLDCLSSLWRGALGSSLFGS
jgi:hypothetical protein